MNLRLLLRVAGPSIALSAALLLLGGLAAWYLHELQRDTTALIRASQAKAEAAEHLELLAYRFRNRITDFLFTGNRKELADIPAMREEVRSNLDGIRPMATTPREQELLGYIEQGYRDLWNQSDRLTSGTGELDRETALALARHITSDEILDPIHAYQDLSREQLAAAGEREWAIADRMGLGLFSLGACAAVAGLVAGFAIAGGIHRSVVQLAVPIRDASGRLSEVVGPITASADPTFQGLESAMQRVAEQVEHVIYRLQETYRAAARAEQLAAMGRLAAGLAHELRNPLTSIKVLVQTAAERAQMVGMDDRDLAVLEEEVDRLDRTIQTFLDYARPPRPEKRLFALRHVAEQTAALVAGRASRSGVRVDCRFPEREIEIEADEDQVRQVLLNLLLNALDATPAGGAVEVGLSEDRWADAAGGSADGSADRRWAKIEVADSGCGLPQELGEKIFEPFFSTKEAGTGLGLPICKRIVEEHGGRIVAENRAGGGALFTVWLPAAPPPGAPTGAVAEALAAE